MNKKNIIVTKSNQQAYYIQQEIIDKTEWKDLGLISPNLPLLSAYSVRENIELPICYYENMSRSNSGEIVLSLLKKFGIEQALDYKPPQLNEFDILIVKFLRAIMLCPKRIVFIMPHLMVPTENYPDFVAFAGTLADFDTTIVEHSIYAGDFFDTKYTEISFEQWATLVLKI